MGRRRSVLLATIKIIKDLLQFIASRDNYSNPYRSQIKKQTKVIEIAVEEWILIVPFNFEGDFVLEAVHLMSRTLVFDFIDYYLGSERFLFPSSLQ